ncbi:MAG: M23 family metallopeptidase [Odoribacteraceae bacterium]|jgi:murein DD-endopeptidase MepM/ murein hydrolase activator NlpD|nr:M23 family metallopeptidase [Odoribacteraceae bacterium]
MIKAGYHFNTETLSFDKVEITVRKKIRRWSLKFFSSFSLAIIWCILFWNFFPSPKENVLKRENEEILSQYNLLSNNVSRLYETLSDLEQRDDNIYRVIFETDPIAPAVRRAGTGGADRYEHLRHFNNADLIIGATRKIDMLSKAIYVQSKSYDEVEHLARNKAEMHASIPAILPVVLSSAACRITSAFGYRQDPIDHVLKPHRGMDFGGPIGTPIYATGNGTVEVSNVGNGFGRHVIVNHGFNYKTLYAHMDRVNVTTGQRVKRGDIIGFLGGTGRATGPHLHYEVRRNGNCIDPINFYFNDLTPEEFDILVDTANSTEQSMD